MNLVTVYDRVEIEKYQRAMEKKLKAGAKDMGICKISFRPAVIEEQVYWLKGRDVWATFGDGGNRYWNAFGLDDPSTGKELGITVELNPPKSGIDRRIGGAFAKDPLTGLRYLVHRGKMGGGKAGIGKYAFLSEYPQPPVSIFDEDKGESPAVIVCILDDPDFADSVTGFVKTVAEIKNKLSEGQEPDQVTPAIAEHTPEFEGPQRPYKVDMVIQAERTHGEVVNALAVHLRRYGTCSNVRTPDGNRPDVLFSFADGRRGSALFEVKTDTTPGSIYTAIGQLLYYARLYKPRPRRLVAVFPDNLNPVVRKRIEGIGLRCMTFKKTGKSVKFKGLQHALKP